MAITPIKAVLFLLGGSAAAAATAYVAGAFDAYLGAPPQVAALPAAPSGAPLAKADRLPGVTPDALAPADEPPPAAPVGAVPASEAPVAEEPAGMASSAPAKPAERIEPAPETAPSFDLVRVESDGSTVIAGKAAPRATIEVVAGADVLGSTAATGEGDFAVVLDRPLRPGDYQITLRSKGPGKAVVSSAETAIVSVPEGVGGEVLAMVEEPGKPAEMISIPEPAKSAQAAPPASGQTMEAPPADAAGEEPPTAAPLPPPDMGTAGAAQSAAEADEPLQVSPPPAGTPGQPAAPSVVVEAVEIEWSMLFVAGTAEPGRRVRGYADSVLLGDAVTSPEGRFLIEVERDLPVGDYVIRIDALEADGATVVARAAVPFEREPGENLAAVAPDAATPGAPAGIAQPKAGPASGTQPSGAQTASAPAGADGVPESGMPPQQTSSPSVADAPAMPSVGEADTPPASAAPTSAGAAPDVEIAAATDAPVEQGAVTAPKLQSVDSAVIIRRGDTLWRISRRVYGRGTRYSTIYLANQEQISDPDLIWPGQVFKVPGRSNEGEAADMSRIGGQATTMPSQAGDTAQQ